MPELKYAIIEFEKPINVRQLDIVLAAVGNHRSVADLFPGGCEVPEVLNIYRAFADWTGRVNQVSEDE